MPRPVLIAASLLCLACLGGIAMAARDLALNAGHAPDMAWRIAGGVFTGALGLAALLIGLAKWRGAAQPGNGDRSSHKSRHS